MLKQSTTITNESGDLTTTLSFDQDTGTITIEQMVLRDSKTVRNVIVIDNERFYTDDVQAIAEMFGSAVASMWSTEEETEEYEED